MPKSKTRKRSTRRPYVPVAPTPAAPKASPPWFGYLVVGLILLGVAMIVLNYMGILPPGQTVQQDRKSTRLNSSHT